MINIKIGGFWVVKSVVYSMLCNYYIKIDKLLYKILKYIVI